MSNLSDLLPAGASAKQITATDSGSGIASKAPVILNSDGTVTEVSSSTATANVGSITTFNSDAATWCATAAGSGSTNLVAYVDSGASSYGTAQVGTISGTGVTFGTKAVFESASVTGIKMAYSSSLDKYLIVYRDNGGSYYGTAVVATVSGTSVTFGTPVVFSARTTYGYGVVYDDTASAFVVQYTNDATVYVRACSVSGTVPTFGGEVTVESSTSYSNSAIGYDSVAGKPVGAWRNYTSQQGKAVVYSLSGTTVTANTPVVFASGSTFSGADASISYNVKENRMVIGYKEGAGTSGTAIAGEVSGTSITFGSAVQFNASSSGSITCDYDATVARTIIGYLDAGAAEYPKAIPVTLSGSTITFPDSATTLQSAAAMNLSASYNGTEGKMLFSWIDTSPTQGESVVFTSPGTVANLTAQAFIGVADSAISASAAGSIIVQGGTVTGPTASVTIAESLSSAFLYAQDGAADPVGSKASGTGSDNFLIAYEVNDGVARGALAQAATVTSGNISYGSSATIGGASTTVYYYSITYDSTNDKFVVFWRNQSNYYIYAAVVTLTGNSISYGAESAVYSAANYNGTDSFSSTYDPDTDRVILGVCDNGDGYAYSVVIELGTTTIDTVGTPEKIDSASATAGYAKNIALCYDTTENKVIATYVYTGGGGSYYLRVAAGTTTGGATNSITWGSSSVVYSGDADYASIAYNATDQRVVIAYKQIADSKGYSSVATVSGTTVTANTPSEFFNGSGGTLYYMGIAHDAYVNKMVIYARASQGDAFNGAIDTAANTITWGTKLDVSSDAYNPPQVVFNASTNQTILSGAGTTKATAGSFIYTVPGTVTGQPLTIGTKYYVTTTGAFSSSADTPSVNAGLAISTTSLLLNGDS